MDKPRLLIVDDEDGIRSALERWFRLRGFDVDEAAGGAEAVEKCRETPYDAITMDLDMPGMGGLEAIEALRKYQPKVPIIVLTGYMRDGQDAVGCDVAKILSKPIRLQDLENHIRELI
jgi:CheY-like chemotaxis protein